MSGRLIAGVIAPLAFAAPMVLLQAQGPSGEQVFKDRCASCHTGGADSRAPSPEALRSRSPQAIVESLVNGAMRTQGSRLTGAERRTVAEYISGRALDGDVRGAAKGMCGTTSGPPWNAPTLPAWQGWSPTSANARF